MMYYILQKDIMQIMNLEKIVKNLWWSLTAFRTINNVPDSIIFIDFQGTIERANRKAYECFGFKIDDENPIKIDNIIKNGLDIIESSIKSGKPVIATAVIPGREFYVELNATKQNDGYCLAVRDLTRLTDEVATEEKIAKFNGEKNAMLVKLEGDIKSPITSISGFSQGLLDGIGGELTEKQAKYIKIINNNSNDLYHFMDKFLEFTYAESSLYEAQSQNFDIVETIKNIVKEYNPIIEQKKLSLDFDYDSIDKRTIYSDAKALPKIVHNILEVAIGMTETGYISINLKNPDERTALKFGVAAPEMLNGFIHLSIKDTGTGIPEEEMRYLCEPYAQLEKGKKNFLRSLNLGTSTILTKRAKGSIVINSEVMKGTTYDIILPIEKEINE